MSKQQKQRKRKAEDDYKEGYITKLLGKWEIGEYYETVMYLSDV